MDRNRRQRQMNQKNASTSLDDPKRSRSYKRKSYAKKGSSFFAKFVCVMLGFILGFIGSLGGIVGLGYITLSQMKVKDVFTTLSGAGVQIEYTDYIREEYGDPTSLELLLTIAEVSKEMTAGTGTFNSLDKISPVVGENVQKLLDKIDEFGLHFDYDEMMTTPLGQLGDLFSKSLNSTELASLVEKLTGNQVDGLLGAICYGEEGVNYTIVDGEIVFLGDSHNLTIGDLTSAEQLSDRLIALSFYTFMSSMGEINTEDPIIRTLVYGTEGEDYKIESDGTITSLPKTYDYYPLKNHFVDVKDKAYTSESATLWKSEYGVQIQLREDNETYQYDVLDAEGNLVYNLKLLETTADGVLRYQAYISDVPQVRRGFTLNDIVGNDGDNIMDNIPLASLLGLSSPYDEGKEQLLIMLAFGEEDTHYARCATDGCGCDGWHFLKDAQGQPYKLRTLTDMTKGGEDSLLKTLSIASLMGINHNSASIMRALAYGNLGTHYELTDANSDGAPDGIQMLPKRYTVGEERKVLDQAGKPVGHLGEQYGSILELIVDENTTQYLRLAAPLSGYYVYASLADATADVNRLTHKKTTLSDMSNTSEFLDRIEMHTIFENVGDSTVMNYILYNDTAGASGANARPRTLGDFTKNSASIINGLTVQKLIKPDALYHYEILGEADANGYATIDTVSGKKQLCIPIYEDSLTPTKYLVVGSSKSENGFITYYKDENKTVPITEGSPLKGCWKYLLVNEDGKEIEASIEQLSTLMDNITKNMQAATLFELTADGLIVKNEDVLNRELMRELTIKTPIQTFTKPVFNEEDAIKFEGKNKFGELTIFDIMNYVNALMRTLDDIKTNGFTLP